MTVCIGAVCEKGKALVVAADRMVTYGAPISMQVEAAVKIIPIADNALVLFSGAASEGEEVANRTKAKIQGGKHDIKTIADFAQVSYQELKRKRAEDMILRPLLGLDFGGFQHLIGQSASSQVLAQILGMVSQHNLQLDVMVAGIDGDGAHLSLVAHPGTVFPMGTIGSWAIGSGGTHASVRMSLARQTKDVSLPETILNVYEAKRASEVAPGVGKLTDMAVLNGKGVTFLESATFKALSSFEKEKPTLSAEDLTKLRKTCEVYADEPAKK